MSLLPFSRTSDNLVAGLNIAGVPNNQDIVMWDSNKNQFVFTPVSNANNLLSALNINVDKNWNQKDITNLGSKFNWANGAEMILVPNTNINLLTFAWRLIPPSTLSTKLSFLYADGSNTTNSIASSETYGDGVIVRNTSQFIARTNVAFVEETLELDPPSDTGTIPIYIIKIKRLAIVVDPIQNRPLFEILNDNLSALKVNLTDVESHGKKVITETVGTVQLLQTQVVIPLATTTILTEFDLVLPDQSNSNVKTQITYNFWIGGNTAGLVQPYTISVKDGTAAFVSVGRGVTSLGPDEGLQASFNFFAIPTGQTIQVQLENTGAAGAITVQAVNTTLGGDSEMITAGVK